MPAPVSSAVQPGAALAAAAVAAVRVRVGVVRGGGVLSLPGGRAGAVTETEELAVRGTRTIRAPVHKAQLLCGLLHNCRGHNFP